MKVARLLNVKSRDFRQTCRFFFFFFCSRTFPERTLRRKVSLKPRQTLQNHPVHSCESQRETGWVES